VPIEKAEKIWMDGEFVAWDEAQIHVLTHGLHYGSGVFEGIRAYETDRGPAAFRLREHLERLQSSARLYYMELPFAIEKLREVTHELIRINKLRSCYIRPIVFRGYGETGLFPLTLPVSVAIAAYPWGLYLGEEVHKKGVRCKVASWRRMSPDSFIPQAKACGQYLNSILAKIETAKAGYDEAILLDEHGNVCEGSGENIFLVRDGEISTPPPTASILDGITRRSVIEIASDLGFAVIERDIARGELYQADELFFTGTATEIAPIREVDDHLLGPPGEITLAIHARFKEAIQGKRPEYLEWLDFVDLEAPEASLEAAEDGGRITRAARRSA
jgi:branched-chain amino acid aminotransferase